MAASAISSSSSSVYRVLSPNLDGQSANSTALPAVLSTPAPIRAAIAQPFASLIAEPEIRPGGRKPFAPGLVTVAGASIARVPKLLAFSSPSLLSVSPEEIGRASCRERVYITVGTGLLDNIYVIAR